MDVKVTKTADPYHAYIGLPNMHTKRKQHRCRVLRE